MEKLEVRKVGGSSCQKSASAGHSPLELPYPTTKNMPSATFPEDGIGKVSSGFSKVSSAFWAKRSQTVARATNLHCCSQPSSVLRVTSADLERRTSCHASKFQSCTHSVYLEVLLHQTSCLPVSRNTSLLTVATFPSTSGSPHAKKQKQDHPLRLGFCCELRIFKPLAVWWGSPGGFSRLPVFCGAVGRKGAWGTWTTAWRSRPTTSTSPGSRRTRKIGQQALRPQGPPPKWFYILWTKYGREPEGLNPMKTKQQGLWIPGFAEDLGRTHLEGGMDQRLLIW